MHWQDETKCEFFFSLWWNEKKKLTMKNACSTPQRQTEEKQHAIEKMDDGVDGGGC